MILAPDLGDRYARALADLVVKPRKWLVTGCAGFIGSNLVEALLNLDQEVVGLDNLATGHLANLEEVKLALSPERRSRFQFLQGDIRDLDACMSAVRGCDFVLHQAALGSVPRSLADPIASNDVNVGGFLNMLMAAKESGVEAFVYAASSSTYGDSARLPKVEDEIGKPLSPYAVTKYANELYADVFHRSYGLNTVGLRYFNVFGRRQDPEGHYAAVIPRWIRAMILGDDVKVNGDGSTSRDFCYVENVVQANILSAVADDGSAQNQVYNVAVGDQTTLVELFYELVRLLREEGIHYKKGPQFGPFRDGDVLHSKADIAKARRLLGYEPQFTVARGLTIAMPWYVAKLGGGVRQSAEEQC